MQKEDFIESNTLSWWKGSTIRNSRAFPQPDKGIYERPTGNIVNVNIHLMVKTDWALPKIISTSGAS